MAVLPIGMSGEAGGYQIERSLRFNSADSAYLSRTPASAGNRKTWTWSGWVKRSALSAFNPLFTAGPTSPRAGINFQSNDKIQLRQVDSTDTEVINLVTTQVFRDVSSWYHIVAAQDTGQATESNRVKIYVNGVQVTAFDTATYPTIDTENLAINANLEHNLGRYVNSPSDGYLNAYLADINFIDGQALTPSSFGETDSDTGVWKPKAYTGSYGTNGFYLKFADNSGTTSTTLGKDSSGNGNNWTPNNFSVTAGAGNDSLVDTPTPYGTDTGAGGEVRGNYCTLNPLFKAGAGTPSYSNGNLDMTAGGTGDSYFAGTTLLTAGKWYYEATITAVGTGGTTILIGVCRPADSTITALNIGSYRSSSEIYNLDGTTQTAGATYTTNDVIGVAIDIDNGTVKFYKNNVGQGATNSFTFTAGTPLIVRGRSDGANPAATFNFGQRPFAYTAPSGFKALCTQNLPEPTVVQGDDYFNTVTRTFTGATASVSSLDFSPDFLWFKRRDGVASHSLYDRLRGTNSRLLSNDTLAEITTTSAELTSFDANGFTVGADSGSISINGPSGGTGVVWAWKANGSGVSNTAGSITSTVSANTTSGFSIVTYTGNGVAGATVGHGLGAVPAMIIVKNRDQADAWQVYHAANTANPETDYLVLNTTAATADALDRWNDTAPTSTVFSLGDGVEVNTNTEDYVAYCFAPIAGFSAFGSYTGNGSADGPFVYTGFRPAFVLTKCSSVSPLSWFIFDAERNAYNVVDDYLVPNSSAAEAGGLDMDFTANGFKIRNTNGNINGSAYTHIYAAFASNPFKYALAR